MGIATSVALTMFQGDELSQAMAVPLYYGLVEAVLLGIYCTIAWKGGWTKAPKNASFWTMIGTSYEVLLDEHSDLAAIEVTLPKHKQDVNEKVNRAGDTIYVRYSMDEDDDDFEVVNCMCIHLPDHATKEASGYQMPDFPEAESDWGRGQQGGGFAPPSTELSSHTSGTMQLPIEGGVSL